MAAPATVRTRLRFPATLTAAAVAALVLAAAPARALTQRGHTYTRFFATSGEGALSHPGAIAVSRQTGDVYVLDRGHNRIVQDTATGEFVAAWGWGVKTNANSWQLCTSACHEGRPHKGFQLADAQAIAVDNSTDFEDPSQGDVYVIAPREKEEEAYEAIEKYSPEGKPLERITKIPYQEEGEPEKLEEPEAGETHGLSIDADGTPWLYYEETLYPLNSTTLKKPATQQPLTFTLTGEPAAGLAAAPGGRFYIGQALPGPTGQPLDLTSTWQTLPAGEELEELQEALDPQNTTALAVNPQDEPADQVDEQGDTYITNTADGASTLAQFNPEGRLLQRAGAPGLTQAAGVTVNPASGAVYVTDAATGKVDLFALEEPSAPTVEDLSVQEVSSLSAQLAGAVDPRGAATTYAFRYSPGPIAPADEPCASPCIETPAPAQTLADDYTDHRVEAKLTLQLSPATTYHYRLLARNAHGAGESSEHSFSTPPSSGRYLADDRVWELVSPPAKSGAEAEPLSETGGLIQAAATGDAITYVTNLPVGEAQGSRTYEPTQMLSCSTRTPTCTGPGGWSSQDIVTPNTHGAGTGPNGSNPPEYESFSQDLALALLHPWRSPDFGEKAQVNNLAEPPLTPPASEAEQQKGQEKTIYLRSDEPIAPHGEAETAIYDQAQANGVSMGNPGYVALVTDANVFAGARFGGENALEYIDATPDLTAAIVESKVTVPGCESPQLGCAAGLYEWTAGRLAPVSVPPCKANPCAAGEQIPVEAQLGGETGRELRHAISNDGSRVFWTLGADDQQHLYMRQVSEPAQTIQLDTLQGGSGEGTAHAVFQTASADGSVVFFTDEQALTPHAGARAGSPDLYACQITQAHGTPACTLTDLTPPLSESSPESADVQGVVLGASEDGSYVYLVADGVLSQSPGAEHDHAEPGACQPGAAHAWREAIEAARQPRDATCNLYLAHYASGSWRTTFIATLSEADAVDWEAGTSFVRAELSEVTSRVSPNGRYLAFMSDMPLTSFEGQPYDNRATTPAAQGAPAQEVYEYAAASEALQAGSLTCASCDPSGARPAAVLDPTRESLIAGGETLLVDRPDAWSARWLAASIPGYTRLAQRAAPYALYQSRFLSDSGRLYFDSPADLVPEATNATEDVYEYEPSGVPAGAHRCSSSSATYSPRSAGCLGLISSGSAGQEAAFVDASESGGEGPAGEQLSEGGADVFFVSSAELVPQDTEPTFSLFDAHECTAASPCIDPPQQQPPEDCQSSESCRAYTPPGGPSLAAPTTAPAGAPGNLAPQHAVLPSKETKPKPKPLTRAQKLTDALKACRARHKHSRNKRAVCEAQARHRYKPIKPAKRSATRARNSGAHAGSGRGPA